MFEARSLSFLAVLAICNFACKEEPAPTAPASAQTAPAAQKAPANTAPASAPAQQGAPAADANAMAEANQIMMSRCSPCHGTDGSGNGPVSAALNPKPRSFKDPEWQKSVTDEHIEKVILQGGPAVGKAPTMPPNPDLAEKKAVIGALRELIRKMGAAQ